MPTASSVNTSTGRPVFEVPPSHRLAMVLAGFIPFLHASVVVTALTLGVTSDAPGVGILATLAVLYLLPPLVSRLISVFIPTPNGRFELHSREFLCWWFHAQWQVIFNRFPGLEEALRMVPGFYSQWLRLWGSRIGSLVFWSSGVTVLDRGCLDIGDRVVLGAGVSLSTHALMPDNGSRNLKLLVSPIAVGRDTLVGGYALLAPGDRIAAEELVPAFLRLAPFSEWKDGKRTRQGSPDWITAAALMAPRPDRTEG